MASLTDRDFDSMVRHLMQRAQVVRESVPPVDLFEVAKLQRVTTVDLRPMLPTGGLTCTLAGFIVYLQDLTRLHPLEISPSVREEDRPRLTTRQRFSLAHELAHTLMFSESNPPQLRADSPKGAKLEALCHRAARRILMPGHMIRAEIRNFDRIGAHEILSISRLFDVSVEVALWRCNELSVVREADRALLYIRRSPDGVDEIVGFFCSDWFEHLKGRPALGMSPVKWLSGLVNEEFWGDPKERCTIRTADGDVNCTRVVLGSNLHFVEIERVRPTSDLFVPDQTPSTMNVLSVAEAEQLTLESFPPIDQIPK